MTALGDTLVKQDSIRYHWKVGVVIMPTFASLVASEFVGDQWSPLTKGQQCWKHFQIMFRPVAVAILSDDKLITFRLPSEWHGFPHGLGQLICSCSKESLPYEWARLSQWQDTINHDQIDWLVQERYNSSALAMELRLSCTNPWKQNMVVFCKLTGWYPIENIRLWCQNWSDLFAHFAQGRCLVQYTIQGWESIMTYFHTSWIIQILTDYQTSLNFGGYSEWWEDINFQNTD